MLKSSIVLYLCTVLISSGKIVKNVPEPPAEMKSIPPLPMKSHGNQNNSLISDEKTVQEGIDISRDAKGILLENTVPSSRSVCCALSASIYLT